MEEGGLLPANSKVRERPVSPHSSCNLLRCLRACVSVCVCDGCAWEYGRELRVAHGEFGMKGRWDRAEGERIGDV